MMLDALSGHYVSGLGFGSYYACPIEIGARSLAWAPHIAALTLLLKGGAIIFLICICLPLARALLSISSSTKTTENVAFACGLLTYVVLASVSGGWTFTAMFIYGACWAGLRRGHRMPTQQRRVVCAAGAAVRGQLQPV